MTRPTREQDELDVELHDLYIEEHVIDICITDMKRKLQKNIEELARVQARILELETKDV